MSMIVSKTIPFSTRFVSSCENVVVIRLANHFQLLCILALFVVCRLSRRPLRSSATRVLLEALVQNYLLLSVITFLRKVVVRN